MDNEDQLISNSTEKERMFELNNEFKHKLISRIPWKNLYLVMKYFLNEVHIFNNIHFS